MYLSDGVPEFRESRAPSSGLVIMRGWGARLGGVRLAAAAAAAVRMPGREVGGATGTVGGIVVRHTPFSQLTSTNCDAAWGKCCTMQTRI